MIHVRQIAPDLRALEGVLIELDVALRQWHALSVRPSPEPVTPANVCRWADTLYEAMEAAIGGIHEEHPTMTAHDMLALILEAVMQVLEPYVDRTFLHEVYDVPADQTPGVIWHQRDVAGAIERQVQGHVEQLSLW